MKSIMLGFSIEQVCAETQVYSEQIKGRVQQHRDLPRRAATLERGDGSYLQMSLPAHPPSIIHAPSDRIHRHLRLI